MSHSLIYLKNNNFEDKAEHQTLNFSPYRKTFFIWGLLLIVCYLIVIPRAQSEVIEVIERSHYIVNEYYDKKESALLACHDFTARHNYEQNCCHIEYFNGNIWYQAGWLKALKDGQKLPFELGNFYFNISCSEGTILDNDTGLCNPE